MTQGTDTIEETSYLLDLWQNGSHPIVVTGAMRPSGLASHDGPANLLAAIQTAASPLSRGRGTLVVMADEIHAASSALKTHSTSLAAFQSPGTGPIGYLAAGEPRYHSPANTIRLSIPPAGENNPTVGLVTVVLGDDGAAIRSSAGHLDGLVVAAMGGPRASIPRARPARRRRTGTCRPRQPHWRWTRADKYVRLPRLGAGSAPARLDPRRTTASAQVPHPPTGRPGSGRHTPARLRQPLPSLAGARTQSNGRGIEAGLPGGLSGNDGNRGPRTATACPRPTAPLWAH